MVEYAKKWTWEEIKIVQTLANKGWSAKNISLELVGRTKNSVIGMCNRQGIKLMAINGKGSYSAIPKTINKNLIVKKPEVKKIFTIEHDENLEEKFEPLNKLLVDLRYGECKAIIGPVKHIETKYCGHKTVEGKSWCPYHFLKYTIPDKGKRI